MEEIEIDDLRINIENDNHTEFRDTIKETLTNEWQDTPTIAEKANEETKQNWKWSYIRYTQVPEWLKYLLSEEKVEMKEESEDEKEKGEAKKFWRLSE